MKLYSGNSFANIYPKLLDDLVHRYTYQVAPRGLVTYENMNVVINLKNCVNNLFNNKVRSVNKKYLSAELVWYFAGNKTANFISNYATIWNQILNPDNKTVNSNYGYIIFKELNEYGFSEWKWSYNSLLKDVNSRQSIIRFNKPNCNFENNKDFVCTLNGIFYIRENNLNMTVYQRSSDIITGLIYDLPFFTLLHQQMYSHLKNSYKELVLGELHHYINSIHIYEKHIDLGKRMLDCKFTEDALPELVTDLIDIEGVPNLILEQLFNKEKIMQNTNDELLNWIVRELLYAK